MNSGQDVRKKHEFRDQSWLGLKTRSRDPTLSRHKGININELYLHTKISQTPTGTCSYHKISIVLLWSDHNINSLTFHRIDYFELIEFPGETWRGKWQGNEIAAKILSIRECTPRISRDFNEEYPKLR